MPLYNILNESQKVHSHIAVVYKKKEGTRKLKMSYKDSCKKPKDTVEASERRKGKTTHLL